MKRKTIYRIILAIILIMVTAYVVLMFFAARGFGNAVFKSLISIEKVKQEWKENNVAPLDSIELYILNAIDTMDVDE